MTTSTSGGASFRAAATLSASAPLSTTSNATTTASSMTRTAMCGRFLHSCPGVRACSAYAPGGERYALRRRMQPLHARAEPSFSRTFLDETVEILQLLPADDVERAARVLRQ